MGMRRIVEIIQALGRSNAVREQIVYSIGGDHTRYCLRSTFTRWVNKNNASRVYGKTRKAEN